MEHNHQTQKQSEEYKEEPQDHNVRSSNYMLATSIVVAALIIGLALIYKAGNDSVSPKDSQSSSASQTAQPTSALEEEVLPARGVTLPVRWGNLGAQMVKTGIIDPQKMEALYVDRGGFTDEMRQILADRGNTPLVMTSANAGYLLNLLWGLGLGTKNDILDKGPMMDPQYGGAGRFASTGGWTLANGDAMTHYSKHALLTLTPGQQALVERVSKNIYRPCCGNATYFPDCNHGMAMLGLLELMASQGVGESEMYKIALAVNSYWFPDTYLTIAKYLGSQGTPWDQADPKQVLGAAFSSAQGYRQILSKVEPVAPKGGSGCGT